MVDTLENGNTNKEYSNISSQWFHESLFESELENSRKSDSMFPEFQKQVKFTKQMERQCNSFQTFISTVQDEDDYIPSSSFHRDSTRLNFKNVKSEKLSNDDSDSLRNNSNKELKNSSAVKVQNLSQIPKTEKAKDSISRNLRSRKKKDQPLPQISTSREYSLRRRQHAKIDNDDSLTKENEPMQENIKKSTEEITLKKQKSTRNTSSNRRHKKLKPSNIDFTTTIKKNKTLMPIKKKYQVNFINFKEDKMNSRSYPVHNETTVFRTTNVKYPSMKEDDDKDSDEELVQRFIKRGKLDLDSALNDLRLYERREATIQKAKSY